MKSGYEAPRRLVAYLGCNLWDGVNRMQPPTSCTVPISGQHTGDAA